MRRLVGFLAALALGYGAVCASVWLAQERLVFQPDRQFDWSPAEDGLAFEDVSLATADGETVHGWYLPPRTGTKHVLFLHGNAGNISHRPRTIGLLAGFGHGVLAIDYRGYGRSTGTPSEAGTYLDARAAWQHLVTGRGIPPDDIVIYGRSLGGAVAVWLAASHRVSGLIVESTFTNMTDMGRHHYAWLPVRLLARIRYDSLSRIAAVSCPILFAHSPGDEVVPFRLGRRLADAAPTLARFVVLDGAHNESFLRGRDGYHALLDAFVRNPGPD